MNGRPGTGDRGELLAAQQYFDATSDGQNVFVIVGGAGNH